MQNLRVGNIIHVQACKADETVYRSWHATIEHADADLIVTIAPPKQPVFDLVRKQYFTVHPLRAYYWFGKNHNLIEVFEPTGELLEIYINVASPPEWADGVLKFKDHELDISKYPPKPAEIIDEDEFAEAVLKYSYSPEFQDKMYAAAREALELAENWIAKPCPIFE
jgi:protein associated with RNAse G/E